MPSSLYNVADLPVAKSTVSPRMRPAIMSKRKENSFPNLFDYRLDILQHITSVIKHLSCRDANEKERYYGTK